MNYSPFFKKKITANNCVITGCRVCPQAAAVHIYYLPMTTFFFKATVEETSSIKDILHSYEVFSGQAVNLQKSAMSDRINKMQSETFLECSMVLKIVDILDFPLSLAGRKKLFFGT